MSGIGKAVWWLQWGALIGTPIWWTWASSLTGGGWGTLLVVLLAVPTFLLMLIAPILGVVNRRLRRAQAMPRTHSVVVVIQWAFGILWPLTIPQVGDIDSTNASVLSNLGLPQAVVGLIDGVSGAAFFLLLVVGLITLFTGLRTVPDAAAAPRIAAAIEHAASGMEN